MQSEKKHTGPILHPDPTDRRLPSTAPLEWEEADQRLNGRKNTWSGIAQKLRRKNKRSR